MHTPGRQQALLVLAATLIFFVHLGGARLWDDDEPKNAQCAREMLAAGDWVVPLFNGGLRYDKPVLVYWLMISAYRLFGDTEFAARFWSAVAAVATTLATYHIGRILFHPRVGFWAGWMLATSVMFVVAGRAATPDSLMMLCTTLAMLAFVRATWGANTTLSGANQLGDFLPRNRLGMATVYVAMALGALAKGPVAVVLPVLVLTVYLVCVRQALRRPAGTSWARRQAGFFSPVAWCVAGWKLRPVTALLVVAAIAGPWYAGVALRTDGDWLAGFLGRHNVGRFVSPMENHSGPLFYYIPAVLFGFFPWSTFLPQAVVRVATQARRSASWAAYVFLACWAGAWIAFFSFSGTKLPSYVTPAYPALAVMTAAWVDGWLSAPAGVNRWLLRQSMASLAVAGILLAVLLPVAARYVLPGEALLAVVGVPLVVGGLLGLRWAVTQPPRAAAALAASSLIFTVSLFGFAAVRVSRHQNSAVLIELLAEIGARPDLAAFDFTVPSLVYYSHGHVPQFQQCDEAIGYLERSPRAVVITYTRAYEELRPRLPPDVAIVARRRRFLRKSEVLVLGRHNETAALQRPKW
ncbi:MAG TPA: glycosyltransferase family 39 protein [Pirellulales bacterium]|jgi:4-amino-4-deoxy-L-arabinose transferase-like glycosyltransferase|nr:glycosyltransferase family 39 protein [Pirellulales bacterium]